MWFEEKQRAVIVFKDFNLRILLVEELDQEWEHFSYQKFVKNFPIEWCVHFLYFRHRKWVSSTSRHTGHHTTREAPHDRWGTASHSIRRTTRYTRHEGSITSHAHDACHTRHFTTRRTSHCLVPHNTTHEAPQRTRTKRFGTKKMWRDTFVKFYSQNRWRKGNGCNFLVLFWFSKSLQNH